MNRALCSVNNELTEKTKFQALEHDDLLGNERKLHNKSKADFLILDAGPQIHWVCENIRFLYSIL